MVGIVLGELYITPKDFLGNFVYWIGLVGFILVGAFPLAYTRSDRIPRITIVVIVGVLVGLAGASYTYPNALAFAFGFPGLFIGLGSRTLLSILRPNA